MDQSPNAVMFFGTLDPAKKNHNQYAKIKVACPKKDLVCKMGDCDVGGGELLIEEAV